MQNVMVMYDEANQLLALRQYREYGPYFLITLSKTTNEILENKRLNELPSNWSAEFINQLLKNGKILKSKGVN